MISDKTAPPITAAKAHSAGKLTIKVRLNSGWSGDHMKLEGSTELTTNQARVLAQSLIDLANAEDRKVANKKEADERKQKWYDREVAAGRLRVMSIGEVFRGR